MCALLFAPLTYLQGQLIIYDHQDSSRIPYAYVVDIISGEKCYTTSEGYLAKNQFSQGDSIRISAQGYKDTLLLLEKPVSHIYLKLEPLLLKEVGIVGSNRARSAFASTRHDTKITTQIGFEFASLIVIPLNRYPIRLTGVKVKIDKAQNQTVRLTIYNQKDNQPNKSITTKLIQVTNDFGKYARVDLTPYQLYLWDNFYLGIEVVDSQNDLKAKDRSKLYLTSENIQKDTFFRFQKNTDWIKVDHDFALCKLLNKEKLSLIIRAQYEY